MASASAAMALAVTRRMTTSMMAPPTGMAAMLPSCDGPDSVILPTAPR
jgi:hypothetical protein